MSQIRTRCTMKDLQKLEVICMDSGKRIGNISDMEIDLECGRIHAIRIPRRMDWNEVFAKSEKRYYRIRWEHIERIGDDFIVVRGFCGSTDSHCE